MPFLCLRAQMLLRDSQGLLSFFWSWPFRWARIVVIVIFIQRCSTSSLTTRQKGFIMDAGGLLTGHRRALRQTILLMSSMSCVLASFRWWALKLLLLERLLLHLMHRVEQSPRWLIMILVLGGCLRCIPCVIVSYWGLATSICIRHVAVLLIVNVVVVIHINFISTEPLTCSDPWCARWSSLVIIRQVHQVLLREVISVFTHNFLWRRWLRSSEDVLNFWSQWFSMIRRGWLLPQLRIVMISMNSLHN